MIIVLVFLIVILSIACSDEDPDGKEILNMERNFVKEEYEEQYKTTTDQITVKKNHVYTFNLSAILSSGTVNISIIDPNGVKLWNKVIGSDDLFEEKVVLSDIPKGDCKIVIEINKETEGKVTYIVKERWK